MGKKLDAYPEIVLEVIHSSPLLNKLEVYAGMGIAEAWIFKDGAFEIFVLDRETMHYAHVARSVLLPTIDFTALAPYILREDTPQALREFAASLPKA